jgi:hypothetical protein
MTTRATMMLIGLATLATLAVAQTPPSTQPSVDDTLNRLLAPSGSGAPAAQPLQPQRPATPPVDRTTGAAAVAPGAESLPVLREGSYVVDRTGRLTRSPDGQWWEFTFESDGRALRDPPMLVLPNLKLMAMEDAARASSRDLRFRITGQVTEYRGRNYVMLEKVVVISDEHF